MPCGRISLKNHKQNCKPSGICPRCYKLEVCCSVKAVQAGVEPGFFGYGLFCLYLLRKFRAAGGLRCQLFCCFLYFIVMGKTNFYLYGVKGKVGNVVAQKAQSGGTMLRSYVVPRNPKTRKQVAQRIIFATVAQAARVLKPLINHSFEGISYGTKSVNRFRKLNLDKLRILAAKDFADTPKAADAQCFFTTKGIRSIIPNQYIVSAGSLSAPALSVRKAGQPNVGAIDGELYMQIAGDSAISIQAVVNDEPVTVTRGQLLKALFGITSLNEQISLCMIINSTPDYQYTYGDESAPGFQIPYTGYNVQRLVMRADPGLNDTFRIGNWVEDEFDPVEDLEETLALFVMEAFDSSLSAAPLMSFMETVLAGFYEASFVAATKNLVLTPIADYNKALNGVVPEDTAVVAAGFIRSRLVGSSWERSNCSLVLSTPTEGYYNNFGLVWAIANDAWNERAEVADSDRYLNEGGSQDQLGENF